MDSLKRTTNARGQIVGMESVKKKKAANEFVATALLDELLTRFAGVVGEFQDALQACAMQGHERFEQFLREGARARIAGGFQLFDDGAYALNFGLQCSVLRHGLLYLKLKAGGCMPTEPITTIPLTRPLSSTTRSVRRPCGRQECRPNIGEW